MNTLSDQQALDAFGFDIRWRYALDVDDQDAYLSRRSLVEFRRRLASNDPDMMMVRTISEGISKSAIEKLGLSTNDQRVDSTHIVSNICTRGRIDLFQKTIGHFIKSKVIEKTGTENDKQIKIEKNSKGETLQSPFDPDASYGHKGKGYSVHIAETCNNKDKSEIITDYEVHGATRSDIGKAVEIVDRLQSAGLKPDTLFADGGYPSGAIICQNHRAKR